MMMLRIYKQKHKGGCNNWDPYEPAYTKGITCIYFYQNQNLFWFNPLQLPENSKNMGMVEVLRNAKALHRQLQ